MPRFHSVAIAALLAAALSPGWAADTPEPTAKANSLSAARAQIAQKNWPAAVAELKKVNETGNADWNNLMGYSLRKGATPDYAGAEKFYNEALRIDPKHRGALEYSGELYLMTGELPKAEQRLAALDKVCALPCEEYSDLKKSVARFKANGNRYVASP
jgi:tetratricopeptide (TPR) repeat protein